MGDCEKAKLRPKATNGCPEYACDNGTCFSEAVMCDGTWDCGNGEDEPLACNGVYIFLIIHKK